MRNSFIFKRILRVEDIVVRRILAYVQSLYPLSGETAPMDADRIYDEHFELVRCAIVKYYFKT